MSEIVREVRAIAVSRGGKPDRILTRYDQERGGRVLEATLFFPQRSGYDDPEPHPRDGPDYVANHAAWEVRRANALPPLCPHDVPLEDVDLCDMCRTRTYTEQNVVDAVEASVTDHYFTKVIPAEDRAEAAESRATELESVVRGLERTLRRVRADRPSAHSDAVWDLINDSLDVASRALLSLPVPPKER